jgi:hypothetical protein
MAVPTDFTNSPDYDYHNYQFQPPVIDESQLGANALLGWGEAAPFPYAPEQGAGAAMPQPGAPPLAPPQAGAQEPPFAGLEDAAVRQYFQENQGPNLLGARLQDLMQRQGSPRRGGGGPPTPRSAAHAAAMVELGKFLMQQAKMHQQRFSLMDAWHAMNGPNERR